jgi:hypothetical protein
MIVATRRGEHGDPVPRFGRQWVGQDSGDDGERMTQ